MAFNTFPSVERVPDSRRDVPHVGQVIQVAMICRPSMRLPSIKTYQKP